MVEYQSCGLYWKLKELNSLMKKNLDVRVTGLNNRFIIASIHNEEMNLKWRALFVYGEPARDLRQAFYDLIIRKISLILSPLLCIDD